MAAGSFAIADEKKPQVMTIEFPALPKGPSRDKKMEEHDAFLASILDWLPSPDYTVIYTTTPSTSMHHSTATEPEPYEMDTTFGAPVHMDLKRDFAVHPRAATNVTLPDGPLFARHPLDLPPEPILIHARLAPKLRPDTRTIAQYTHGVLDDIQGREAALRLGIDVAQRDLALVVQVPEMHGAALALDDVLAVAVAEPLQEPQFPAAGLQVHGRQGAEGVFETPDRGRALNGGGLQQGRV
ncbi:MAG: hypothetical protein Q9191_005984 [Dirinaria sp. TL-2023a]